MAESTSKLSSHGFRFCNWAGPGEEAATKFGISHAVVVPPNVRTVIVGGQIGVKDDGTVSTDLAEEITEAFDHVERSLKAAGLGDDAWEHVYSVSLLAMSCLSSQAWPSAHLLYDPPARLNPLLTPLVSTHTEQREKE